MGCSFRPDWVAGITGIRSVLLSVMGAVQYGTSKVFYTIVPHCEAQERRPYSHQGLSLIHI